jgi:hypothetical protein
MTQHRERVLSNPLPWLRQRKLVFPHLYHLVIYYLSRPASSAAAESIFSCSGDMFAWNEKAENFETKVTVKRIVLWWSLFMLETEDPADNADQPVPAMNAVLEL